MPYELRPYPAPTLRPEDIQNGWRTSVYPTADQMGVDIKLPTISPQPYTRLAFEGLEFAKEHGRADAYNSSVMRGFFQRDLDIGDIDVLQGLALEVGLDATEFRLALESGALRKRHQDLLRHANEQVRVPGVPLFVIEEIRLQGIQDRRTLEAAIERAGAAQFMPPS